MMDDSDIVSRSYLTIFFMDINALKDSLTGYRSIILRLGITPNTTADVILKGLDDKLTNAVIQWSDSVRHNVERCQIASVALSESIKDLKSKTLDASYTKIIGQFAPDPKDVSDYTFEINKLFVKSTIDKLINKMENFYDEFTNKK